MVRAGGAQLAATEWSMGVTTVAARHTFWGAGLELAHRPSGQVRGAVAAAAGARDGQAAVRLDATAQFVVTPSARTGVTLSGGLGLAYAGARHTRGAAWATVQLGAETAAGRRRGWFLEVGLGGGLRVAAGWRWRSFPSWW
jgi:hypothetical protein